MAQALDVHPLRLGFAIPVSGAVRCTVLEQVLTALVYSLQQVPRCVTLLLGAVAPPLATRISLVAQLLTRVASRALVAAPRCAVRSTK